MAQQEERLLEQLKLATRMIWAVAFGRTPVQEGVGVSRSAGIETSLDAAHTSACATSGV
jgi:hypothetical protein